MVGAVVVAGWVCTDDACTAVNLSLFNDIVLGIGEIGTEPSVDVGITSIDEVTTEAGSQFDGPEWGLYPQRL